MDARIERVCSAPDAGDDAGPGEDGDAGHAGTNTWIVGDDDEVIVIDPGDDADAVLEAVGDRWVLAVICTHGHLAHVAAALEVAAADPEEVAPVALHPSDRLLWRAEFDDPPEIDMAHGGSFDVADVTLQVLHTPGHTAGSVSLYAAKLSAVFTGDALLASGPAPHDGELPDLPAQLSAIGEVLLDLPPATRVLPGHGEETTIGAASKRFDSWVSAGPGQ